MTDDATPSTSSPEPPPPVAADRPGLLPELSPRTMWLTAAVIAVLTVAAVVVLWWPATAGLTGDKLVSNRLDALKIGLSIGLGSGGVVALYLSWRRQYSTEADLDNRERTLAHQQEVHAATLAYQDRVASGTEYDADQRRLDERPPGAGADGAREDRPLRAHRCRWCFGLVVFRWPARVCGGAPDCGSLA